ncbi:phosphatidylglycerophosphatase and protein-tyrosine phosphatase 1-like isoform X1 [Pomacea canaliculata]|uniref:phosphatidylglycerophosphatase and protein-tyrosine phosphatase 1-like isoform X1 n=1 Tax=Pomacea canaliculata TaxID=400727 RepID=UPI000D7253B9|nr:phosphatidylglycerophosphatase and protein-tyrosine phosphatase 1-like isoform X1 [Pomacea canaliculata]
MTSSVPGWCEWWSFGVNSFPWLAITAVCLTSAVIFTMPVSPADVFARVAFYPTLFYTYIMSQVSSRQWYNRIDQWVIIGALPVKSIAKQLVAQEGIKGVVSLTQEHEMRDWIPSEEEWKEMGVEQLKIPTIDFTGTPTQENIHKAVKFIIGHRNLNNSVYVHCKAGRTRSAVVVACYLIHVNRWTPEEAVEYIKTKRPHIWLRDLQFKSLAIFNDNLKSTNR